MLPTAWRVLLRRRRGPEVREESFFKSPSEVVGGNRIVLLNDGRETYPAMLAAIESAARTVHLETYILRSDRAGWRFARLLADKARAGVAVRVIFDSVGSLDISEEMTGMLRSAGAGLLEYRPVAPWRRRWGWGRRDHRKILVVDGRTAFTGGVNISDDYGDPADGGGGWRDLHVQVEGPAAYELDRIFRANWYRETGRWFTIEGDPDAARGATPILVTANQEFLHRHRIRGAYLHALRRARLRISIANAYYVPDRGIRRALYAAGRRGAEVRVLNPAAPDVPAVGYASRYRYEDHLRNGIRLFAWPRTVLHTKLVVVDGVWCAVGSYNMDHRSWLHNLEVNLHVLDGDFCRTAERSFEADLAASREITLAQWLERPLQEKLLERLFYAARYWL